MNVDQDFRIYLNTNPRVLRITMAVAAFAFPIVVILTGYADDCVLQDSLSAYYWASGSGQHWARAPFSIILFMLGVFLAIYKGFTREEDHVLNVAGFAAVGVVWFPMQWTCDVGCGFAIHGALASLLFICLAYIMWFRAKDTLRYVNDQKLHRRYWRTYNVLSLCALLTPVVAASLNYFIGGSKFTLLAEICGIWSFAAFWAVKEHELQNFS